MPSSTLSSKSQAERKLRLAQLKLRDAQREADLEVMRAEIEAERKEREVALKKLEMDAMVAAAETAAEEALIELESVHGSSVNGDLTLSKVSTRPQIGPLKDHSDKGESSAKFTSTVQHCQFTPFKLDELPESRNPVPLRQFAKQSANRDLLGFMDQASDLGPKIGCKDSDKLAAGSAQDPLPTNGTSLSLDCMPRLSGVQRLPSSPHGAGALLAEWLNGRTVGRDNQLLRPPQIENEAGHPTPQQLAKLTDGGASRLPDQGTPHVGAVPLQHERASTNVQELSQLAQALQTGVTDGMTNAMMSVATVIRQGFALPNIKISVFDGDILRYPEFVREFNASIGSSQLDVATKLNYLISHCSGQAKEMIRSCGNLPPEKGYEMACGILHRNYGQRHLIIDSHLQLLTEGPAIRVNDIDAWDRLLTEARSCLITFHDWGARDTLDDLNNMRKVVKRFPTQHMWKFANIASDRYMSGEIVNFDTLLAFLESVSNVNRSGFGKLALDSQKSKKKPTEYDGKQNKRSGSSYLITEEEPSAPVSESKPEKLSVVKCPKCEGDHRLWKCDAFKNDNVSARFAFAKRNRICFNCLVPNHGVSECKSTHHCKKCNRKHNTLLHFENAAESPKATHGNEAAASSKNPNGAGVATTEESASTDGNGAGAHVSMSTCAAGSKSTTRVLRKVVPVQVWGTDDLHCDTYAFLDDGSDVSLCTSELMTRLNLKGDAELIILKTLGGTIETQSPCISFKIRGMNETTAIHMDDVRVIDKLPEDLESNIPTQKIASRYKHLQDLEFPQYNNAKVEILIGMDTPEAHACGLTRRGDKGEPYAVHTGIGWALYGIQERLVQGKTKHSNFIKLDNEQLHVQMEQAFEHEFKDSYGCSINTMPSIEDKKALSMMEKSVCKVDGHYQVGIPWRSPDVELPDNRKLAERRLENLKKRFMKDDEFHKKYTLKMEEYISSGHAQRIPKDQLLPGSKTWYIPHHGTGDKFRIVFDASGKWDGTSLNENVLCGPTMTSSLFGVLLRYREEEVCWIGDIKSMYYQVRVSPEDRDSLRFLWYPGGDYTKPAVEYFMTKHIFGGIWAASTACYALRKVARDNINYHDKEALEAIENSFYVDDILRSESSVSAAIERIENLTKLLDENGFPLTKFISNKKEVLQSILDADKCKEAYEFEHDDLTSQKALGLLWNIPEDAFQFEVCIDKQVNTRRSLLSTISKIFDPLGMLGPFVLPMRRLLQHMCALDLKWDEELPPDAVKLWENWLEQLPELKKVSIPRWFQGSKFGKSMMQLHTFCDASETGLGAVSYIRVVNVEGIIHCEFIAGKSRVSPLKSITIPRLELSAAVIAVKLSAMIRMESKYNFEKVIYWTDSTSVLQYINNTTTRFKVFVGNRLAFIHESSRPEQWHHVGTKENPADLASRGVMPSKLKKCKQWFHGPEFLWKDEKCWPKRPSVLQTVSSDDPEVKQMSLVCATTTSDMKPGLECLLEKFSSLLKLQKTFAWIGRFKKLVMWKFGGKEKLNFTSLGLEAEEIESATLDIIYLVQQVTFSEDVKGLKRTSSLRSLTPCLKNDLICVGGRLQNSSLSEESKNQIILPYRHHVTDLLIDHYHVLEGHSGTLHVLASIRQKYWIIKGHSAVRRRLLSCMKCKLLNAKPGVQIMAPLPQERVITGKPVFTVTGVDLMGPYMIKSGRSEVKRWAVIFTCMATRALHIEVVNSLEAYAFLEAFERFVSRRGKPQICFSDNGTNFTSANKILEEGLTRWNKSVHENLCQMGIKWKFNPPAASHWGGCWERMIRSVRKVLTALVGERKLDDFAFYTFLTKVERILNNRPITPIGDDPRDFNALTPGMLLTGRLDPDYPPDIFVKADGYRKSWKLINLMADDFWTRFKREYLQILQIRQKWHQETTNFAVGDMVLIMNDTAPRGVWPKAIVEETFPDQNGMVRRVRVRTATSTYIRDIRKLCRLEGI